MEIWPKKWLSINILQLKKREKDTVYHIHRFAQYHTEAIEAEKNAIEKSHKHIL